MKNNICYFIGLLCLQSILLRAQESNKKVEENIRRVEQNLGTWVKIEGAHKWTLQDRMKYHYVKGVSIAVIKDYKIEWAKGYGWADSDEKRPVTIHTLFQAASNSKSLNAVGILKLVQERKIDLTKDINTYVKSWKFPYDSVSKGKKITVANLLSHTAGLSVDGFYGYVKGDSIPTIIQILDGKKPANSQPVRSAEEPTIKFKYSGGGTTISQLIVEDITGQTYDEYMYNHVLQPMGMTESFYTQPPPANKQSLLATGYYANGKELKGKYPIHPEKAAAGLWTTPTDLAKFVIEMQLSLQGKSNKLLSTKTTEIMFTPYMDNASALGVFIQNKDNTTYFHHGGGNAGFVSNYYGSMENGNGVVVMLNADNDNPGTQLLEEIINSVAATYNWKNFYNPVIKKEYSINKNKLDFYAGKYKIANDTILVTNKADGLWLTMNGSMCKMHFIDDTGFFLYESVQVEFDFLYNNEKKISKLLINKKYKATKLP